MKCSDHHSKVSIPTLTLSPIPMCGRSWKSDFTIQIRTLHATSSESKGPCTRLCATPFGRGKLWRLCTNPCGEGLHRCYRQPPLVGGLYRGHTQIPVDGAFTGVSGNPLWKEPCTGIAFKGPWKGACQGAAVTCMWVVNNSQGLHANPSETPLKSSMKRGCLWEKRIWLLLD